MAAIDIANITKAYGTTRVIHGISLRVEDGAFVVLVGPSGCGKSTLLRMIAGLESVTGGDITIAGSRVNDLPPRERDIAMVFQDYALYPHKSVAENIGFGLKMRGEDAITIEKKVKDAAEILQITQLLDRKPGQLSGGQRQRVAMGRAIVRDPKVFLFDEPLSNLDAQLRAEMRIEIKKLHQRFGTTILYVTHDQVEAMTLADRIALLRAGHVEQYDTPDGVYNAPASTFVAGFIGAPTMSMVSAIVTEGGAMLTLAGGVQLAVPPSRKSALAPHNGKSITCGLRPEHIGPAQHSEGGLAATIALTEPLGSDTMVLLRIGDCEITGRFPPDSSLKTGLTLPIHLKLEHAHFFASDTGKRLTR